MNIVMERKLSALEVVREMKIGWNLGNSLDAPGRETAWKNPVTTRPMIDQVKAMGFKTVRIPVTWNGHFGGAPDYTIDPAWLDRVEEVANYVLANGMYAIINLHHDNSWLRPVYEDQARATVQLIQIWQQIATRFKAYSDYLLLETMNEPRIEGGTEEWSGGTAENRAVINAFNLAAVNAIRNTGGNNRTRLILIPTHAATARQVAIDALVMPGNDSRIIISLHTYWPNAFCMEPGGTAHWGSAEDRLACDAELDRIYDKFGKNGLAVVIGEWGSVDKNNPASRVTHAEYYANAVRKRGMLSLWWDNGYTGGSGFALLNRSACSWYFPEVAVALVRGAESAESAESPAG